MNKIRTIRKIIRSQPTIEGAGVRLNRAFGFSHANDFDPFLLLDDFRSEDPGEYEKGFPWHPHRGMETITYVLRGRVEHADSMGNKGVIGPGDVQWMTAGSGIIHQEMPKGDEQGRMGGFQLWANLPASHKMMDPRYREVKSEEIPTVVTPEGATVRLISGEAGGSRGPVRDIVTDPEYLDVTVPARSEFRHRTRQGHTVLVYVREGQGRFDQGDDRWASNHDLVMFDDGAEVAVSTADEPVRFLFMSGKPLREPVAWYGPIVMNTQEEVRQAFEAFRNGTFVKQTVTLEK